MGYQVNLWQKRERKHEQKKQQKTERRKSQKLNVLIMGLFWTCRLFPVFQWKSVYGHRKRTEIFHWKSPRRLQFSCHLPPIKELIRNKGVTSDAADPPWKHEGPVLVLCARRSRCFISPLRPRWKSQVERRGSIINSSVGWKEKLQTTFNPHDHILMTALRDRL